MKRILSVCLLYLFAVFACSIMAQLPHTFTHYTGDGRFSQRIVSYMMQDSKGIMWFGTWDGLYKFDGYTFMECNINSSNSTQLGSTRVLKVIEDKLGYIWLLNDDSKVYRFNPMTEQITAIPYKSYSAIDFFCSNTNEIYVTTRQDGLVHITTHPDTHAISAVDFFEEHNLPVADKINNVWMDDVEENVWILTDNGVHCYNQNEDKVKTYFEGHVFYDILKYGDNYFVASNKGEIIQLGSEKHLSIFLPTISIIKQIVPFGNNQLLVATDCDGLFMYNLTNKDYKHYTSKEYPQMKDIHINRIYVDRQGDAWIHTNSAGVVHFSSQTHKFRHFILKDKYGNDIKNSHMDMQIIEDIYDTLWIHLPEGSFAWYDRQEQELKPFYDSNIQTGWSGANYMMGCYSDKQGNLWMVTFKNGLTKVTFNQNTFSRQSIEQDDPDFEGNNVRAVYQDKDGYIWVGSKDGIVRLYDNQKNYIGNLTGKGTFIPYSKEELGMAYCFVQSADGTMWIGTKGNGLLAAVPQRGTLKYRIHKYRHQANNLYSLSSDNIYSLCIDHQRLWIATYGEGICYTDLNEELNDYKHFIGHRNELKNYPIHSANKVRCITLSPEGFLYAGTTNGIVKCDNPKAHPQDMTFGHTTSIPGDTKSLSNNNVHEIFFSKNGDMYACTFGGGLNRMTGYKDGKPCFESYTTKHGLTSDALLSIQEDAKGNIWLATERELCKYDPTTKQIINYPFRLFPQHTVFNEGRAIHTTEGNLLFNTMQGILYFRPESIHKSNYIPPIILTHFQLTEDTDDKAVELYPDIDNRKDITLSHKQNGFNIQFAALDMLHPENIKYTYHLEGFEKNWNEVGYQHNATYTNLPHGNYTLKIKSTNSDGIWVDNMRELRISVLPSFWETPIAYVLYVLAVLLVIFIATYILFVFFRLKHKVAMEEHISDIKLRFFTNISHELRTPLTLIIGPIEQILQHGNLQETDREQLILMKRNTNRMLRLVNQILDFRKIQNKKMKLRIQQIDIIPFTRHLMESFQVLAKEHAIDFSLETSLTDHRIWADADKLEKILFNLLSNAFKYTPKGKAIKVYIRDANTDTILVIEDQGIGIDEHKQKSLFVRFENFADKNLFNSASTGIGLSLVKELVEMHKGHISVESKKGEGSRFIIQLPNGKEHFDADTEFILSDSIVTSMNDTISPNQWLPKMAVDSEYDMDKEKDTLLIVEDNTELRYFLHHLFDSVFNIIEAENGKIGWEKSKELVPDIIISDVMMPEMDGIEMMKLIRNERTTSHIPVVLLTAKSNVESKIEGMEVGADDYITKPFSGNYLKARIFNLLEQRRKLQAFYCATILPDNEKPLEMENPAVPNMSSSDRQFMDNLMAFVHEHIDNGDLKIEDIANGINMSRSVFFKKLKALTGLSPNELLKNVRIKQAAKLIKENNYSMQQIAFMVGFNDAHYFSRCFKQKYGMTPSEYKEQ